MYKYTLIFLFFGTVEAQPFSAAALISAPYSGSSAPTPINDWKLNDLSGTFAVDSIAGNTATVPASAVWVPDKFGNAGHALQLNPIAGQNAGVFATPTTATSTFTISLWFNMGSGGDTDPGLFINFTSFKGIYLRTGLPGYAFYDGAYQNITATLPSAATWNSLVFSCNAGAATLYINGTSVGTCTVSGTQSFTQFGGETGDLYSGIFDDIQYYSVALTNTQAADINTAGPK